MILPSIKAAPEMKQAGAMAGLLQRQYPAAITAA